MAHFKVQPLLAEMTEVLGALSASHEVLLGRLRRIRIEGFAAVPSSAGFVPPVAYPASSEVTRHEVIDVERQLIETTDDLPIVARQPSGADATSRVSTALPISKPN